MFKQILALTFFAILFVDFSKADQKLYNITAQEISEDRAFFLRQNRAQETYYLDENKWFVGGERIKGDTLRFKDEDRFQFNELTDFYYEIIHPKQDDYYITHISAFVQQSSKLGEAYIINGGIGYTHMHLIFEVKRTKYFIPEVFVFGRTFT